mmetsp:Transcript_21353/g.53810  ORF Transcript_21353/g.53810 Transcript_21353/m.53810 type:complete len:577 (-) Transcript_21353:94-1824(-)
MPSSPPSGLRLAYNMELRQIGSFISPDPHFVTCSEFGHCSGFKTEPFPAMPWKPTPTTGTQDARLDGALFYDPASRELRLVPCFTGTPKVSGDDTVVIEVACEVDKYYTCPLRGPDPVLASSWKPPSKGTSQHSAGPTMIQLSSTMVCNRISLLPIATPTPVAGPEVTLQASSTGTTRVFDICALTPRQEKSRNDSDRAAKQDSRTPNQGNAQRSEQQSHDTRSVERPSGSSCSRPATAAKSKSQQLEQAILEAERFRDTSNQLKRQVVQLEEELASAQKLLANTERERNTLLETHMGIYHQGLSDINSAAGSVSKADFEAQHKRLSDSLKKWTKALVQLQKKAAGDEDVWIGNLPILPPKHKSILQALLMRIKSTNVRRDCVMGAASAVLFAGFEGENLACPYRQNSDCLIRGSSSGLYDHLEDHRRQLTHEYRELQDQEDSREFGKEFEIWARDVRHALQIVLYQTNTKETEQSNLSDVLRECWLLHMLSGCFPAPPHLVWPAQMSCLPRHQVSALVDEVMYDDGDADECSRTSRPKTCIFTILPGFRFGDMAVAKAQVLTMPFDAIGNSKAAP